MNSPNEQRAEKQRHHEESTDATATHEYCEQRGDCVVCDPEHACSQPEIQNPKPETESDAPILYDADAEQRIPFEFEHNGERYEVAFFMGPQTDPALKQYEVLLDQRANSAEDSSDPDAMEQTDRGTEAAAWLFDDRGVSVDGFDFEGDQLPPNWKDEFEAVDKEAVVDTYLTAEVVKLPPAKPGKKLPLKFRQLETISVIKLRALYSGSQLELTHKRTRPLTEKEYGFDPFAEFNAIRKRAWTVRGVRLNERQLVIPPKGHRFAELYDRLGYETSGYRGRAPLHHKSRVVQADLSKALKATEKK